MIQVIYQSLFKNALVILEQFQKPKMIFKKIYLDNTISKYFFDLVKLELHLHWFVQILAKFIT